MPPSDHGGAIDRIWRRMQAVIGRGRVTVSNDTGRVQTMQVRLGSNETRDATPRLGEFGHASRPPVGADVLVLFVAGDRSNGVVIATGDQATRPLNLLEGESQLYDLWGKSVYLTKASGIVIEAKDTAITANDVTTMTVTASESVQLDTPLLDVTGTIKAGNGASGSFSTPTGQTVTVQDGIVTNIF